MNHATIRCCAGPRCFPGLFIMFLAGILALGTAASAESARNDPALTIRVTHLLGFASARKSAKGTLTIESEILLFQQGRHPAVAIDIPSISDIYVGQQNRQVGGRPMALGKAALPYSGGRVVSLFAHKKYDTLTLEYLDADGGLHGAIFEIKKGQAQQFRDELVSRGAHVSNTHSRPAKQIAEALSESR